MSWSHSSFVNVVAALCVGLAVLCAITGPVFATMQELHEMSHGVPHGASDEAIAEAVDSAEPSDAGMEGVYHAPHCCLHAVLLPEPVSVEGQAMPQAPPGFVPPREHLTSLSRALRPPISA
ncbi:hypothetical protein [Chiayiivirga flava]|uniref:Uncharacterized protein n=1 Tax=Chiayiivirga flava TaxID=659595 RepID=A0A7W8D7E4_9GAMM|nr:hypothetical protein [Chiayiivirga flava]MBB5208932.1 hypothetical protein [Chiayiivirga flava]